MRYCPQCGGKMITRTSRGGIPRRECENAPHDDGGVV
jgi:predicted RNA-binding Zn-ribbon protein involved in translation (DUF1610 family)